MKSDLDIIIINVYTIFHSNMCNLCKKRMETICGPNDRQRGTDRRTAAKQSALKKHVHSNQSNGFYFFTQMVYLILLHYVLKKD